jgi:hypothetical protein
MKQHFGNYLGICINNVDPEHRGRVQVFVPHIMPALYEGWNELGEDIKLECVGNNLPNGLSSDVIEKLTKILPWCEAATPIIGNSVAGSYNPQTGNFNQTNTPEALATAGTTTDPSKRIVSASGTDGSGATTVTYADGTTTTLTGPRPIRNNNPGNLEFGPFARSQGAVGSDGRYAVFPTPEIGQQAKINLLKTSTYQNLTLRDAFNRYAPPSENPNYLRDLNNFTGFDLNRRLNSLADSEFNTLIGAVSKIEGFGAPIDLRNPATAPDPSATGVSGGPFYAGDQKEPHHVQPKPNDEAVTQISAPTSAQRTQSNFITNGADMGKLNSEFRNRAEGMAAEFEQLTGKKMRIMGARSAYRTFQEQVNIYATARPGYAATPGTSNHGFGFALDIVTSDANKAAQLGLLEKYKLTRPFVGSGSKIFEPWHIEPVGLDSSKLREYKNRKESGKFTGDELAFALDPNAQVPPSTPGSSDSGPVVATGFIKNPTETQPTTLDTTGMAQGMFGIPGPGAMLWVFFREGNPMFPVYFAASYGAAEWQSAYKASSPDAYGPQENNSNSISNQAIFRPNNAGALTFTGAVNTEKDSRAIRIAHANGGYLEFHPYGSVQYSPNEHLRHVSGTSYSYCINREEWSQGDDNKVVIGNQWIVIGNPSQANIETIEKLTEKVKQINAEMMKN